MEMMILWQMVVRRGQQDVRIHKASAVISVSIIKSNEDIPGRVVSTATSGKAAGSRTSGKQGCKDLIWPFLHVSTDIS